MLNTKLNRQALTKDLLQRKRLLDNLDERSHLPFILLSAPAGYGKSIVVSQWLEHCQNNYAWLSLDKNMNDSATFISYFIEMLKRSESVEIEKLKELEKGLHFLSWEAIINSIINIVNEFQKQTSLIFDDYYLIHNPDIHQLIETLLKENLVNLQIIIITRWDPPFQLKELRVYQKMIELRMRTLKFDEEEIAQLIAIENLEGFSEEKIKELNAKTEGWILAIRMILLTRSFTSSENKNISAEILTNDLDRLMSLISENLDPSFLRQMQLSALCDQFNAELVNSICDFAFHGSCKGDVFISKLKELNFFLIPTSNNGSWYRFHHLIGDILKRQVKISDQDIIGPLYLHISSWFSDKGLIDEAILYAIKAENVDLACKLITSNRRKVLDQGKWWVVQGWLEKIPEIIRKSNVDLLLTELRICEETWKVEDIFSILSTLKSMNIENADAKTKSEFLFHLGHHHTFLQPDSKKAIEYLEKSKLLYQDENMFGARRELILATARQMNGQSAFALQSLDEIEKEYSPSSLMFLRSLNSRIFVHLLNGEMAEAIMASERFYFSARNCENKVVEANSWYFQGNLAFQTFNKDKIDQAFNENLLFKGMLNYRMYFDALAGLILINSLKGKQKATEFFLMKMDQAATELKDPKFHIYYRSLKARVNLHNKKGNQDLDWAKNDWMKQSVASYFFLIDVPELTKIRILISYGSMLHVEEVLRVLSETEVMLNNNHNSYHLIDIELLKAMALVRLGNKTQAAKSLEKAMIMAENSEMIRPIIEAYRIMPSLFNLSVASNLSNRMAAKLGLDFPIVKLLPQSRPNYEELTLREQDVVKLISDGLRNKEIADQLNISTVTVKSHLTNIYKKLDVPNRTSMLNKIMNTSFLS
jgi:ATP/maltotriose-dependent transcriptional regulator MalT